MWRCTQATGTHSSPAHLSASLSTSVPDYAGLCSAWQDTSWHYWASPCQPPAWIPSPPLGETDTPHTALAPSHFDLGLLLSILCISARCPGDTCTASEHLLPTQGLANGQRRKMTNEPAEKYRGFPFQLACRAKSTPWLITDSLDPSHCRQPDPMGSYSKTVLGPLPKRFSK